MSSIIRRFSRSSSVRNSQHSQDSRLSTGSQQYNQQRGSGAGGGEPYTSDHETPPVSASAGPAGPAASNMMPNGGVVGGHQSHPHSRAASGVVANDNSRPHSAVSNSSFDFLTQPNQQHSQHQQPVHSQSQSHPQAPIQSQHGPTQSTATGYSAPSGTIGNLSRTDQIVLRHFWEDKYEENAKRDLHFLKFPFFGQYPSHKDLMPYCEIYHLIKTSPGANIISLGSANGVYIGFELSTGAQLHIDMDDSWQNISHHRVSFKPYDVMLRDPTSEATFRSWPKPLTIEFLEDQYAGKWTGDLTSFCWTDESVRELGTPAPGQTSATAGGGAINGVSTGADM